MTRTLKTIFAPSNLLLIIILAGLYYVCGRLGLLLAIPPGYATLFWPASGVAVAFAYHFGVRVAPGIWIGSSLLNFITAFEKTDVASLDVVALNALVIGLGSMLQAIFAVFLVNRVMGRKTKLERQRDIAFFLVLAGPVSGLLAASCGVSILLLTQTISIENYFFTWVTWYTGDVLGILVFAPILVLLFSKHVSGLRKLQVSVPLLLIFSTVITVFVMSHNWHESKLKDNFINDTILIRENLEARFQTYLSDLENLHNFYNSSDFVTRKEFYNYVYPTLKKRQGIRRLIWVPYIASANKETFVNTVRSSDLETFSIYKNDENQTAITNYESDIYLPILYAEPMTKELLPWLGVDLGQDPTRRTSILKALEKGTAQSTPRVRFFSETDANQYGIVVFIPVFEKNMTFNTTESRQQNIVGFIGGVYRIHNVIYPMISPWKSRKDIDIDFYHINQDTGENELLYSSYTQSGLPPTHENQGQDSAAFTEEYSINLFGEKWIIRLFQSKEYKLANMDLSIWIILAAGILFTALLGAFLLILTGRTAEIEAVVLDRTAALNAAREMAEKSNATKSQFLANMSHEIRTPMTAIIGMIRLLKNMPLSSQEKHYVETIDYSADSMLQIIDDILDFSKIEAGKLSLENIPFNMHKLCKDIIELFVIRAWEKGIEFRLEYDPECPKYLIGDPSRLRQILFNLCGNALKFTARGHVVLAVRHVQTDTKNNTAHLGISVTDTGIGIPLEKQRDIFGKFSQLDTSTSRKYGGSGLGLAITRELLHMMQSEIYVLSTPGEGATFSFDLTLPICEKKIFDKHEGPLNKEQAYYGGARILLAEDNLVNQEVIGTFLNNRGIDVKTVANGHDVIAALEESGEQNRFDLIFMDCQMPIMDGYEATRHIRENSAFHDIPIIAVTARAFEDDRENCLRHGMNDYLSKPVHEAELDVILEKWLTEKKDKKDKEMTHDGDVKSSYDLPTLDENVTTSLKKSTGEKYQSILAMYVKEGHELLKKMEDGLAQDNAELIEFAAHSFKTASGQLGAKALHQHMQIIESKAAQGDLFGMAEKIGRAHSLFFEAQQALQQNNAD